MKKAVIIVAGGSGTRMGSDLPKQFLELCGRPVIVHTIEAFVEACPEAEIIIVVHGQYIDLCQKILTDHFPGEDSIKITPGGNTRTESVINGLQMVGDAAIIAVHDAVRPLVSRELITRCFEAAAQSGSAVPCIPAADSFIEVTEGKITPLDRSLLRAVQTPQIFLRHLLDEAYKNIDPDANFTDDASVVMASGHQVTLIDGEAVNLKVTTPVDLAVAGVLLSKRMS